MPKVDGISVSDRVISSYKQLSQASKQLNEAVNEWAADISALNDALGVLDIGVSAWHVISEGQDDDLDWRSREIGYAKVADEWQLALRRRWGNHNRPDDDGEEIWPFSEAPRYLMLEGAAKIPDLLETLTKRTDDTIKRVIKRRDETRSFSAALGSLAQGIETERTADIFGTDGAK